MAKYKYQELYINGVPTFYKSPSERKKRVDYCRWGDYNGVRLYGVDGLLQSTSSFTYIRDLIREYKAAGVTRVAIAYSSLAGQQAVTAFMKSPVHADNLGKPTALVSEIEPWVSSSGVSWSSFITALKAAKALEAPHALESSSYLGWPQKPTGTSTDGNVRNVILYSRPTLHVYTYGAPKYSYLRTRLTWFAAQAAALGYSATNRLRVLPIFSAEPEFSGEWFRTHSPVQAMDAITAALAADSFNYKSCLDLSGFVVFKYSDIAMVRPMTLT